MNIRFFSIITATLLLTGCSSKGFFTDKSKNYLPEDGLDVYESGFKNPDIDKTKKIKDIIFYQKDKNSIKSDVSTIADENIILTDDEDDYDIIPSELRTKTIKSLDIINQPLGSVVKLLLLQTDNVGFIVEPNVDLNSNITTTVKNKGIYDTIKDICLSAGYHSYYSEEKKSIIISPYISRRYQVPPDMFIDSSASISMGQNNGAIKPELKISNSDTFKEFMEGLDNVGSSEKIVSINRQTGMIYVKERPNFISEIDKYVKDFVANKSEQFNVEFVALQLNENSLDRFGFDIGDIVTKVGKGKINISSLSGNPITPDSIVATINSGGIIVSGAFNNYSSASDPRTGYDLIAEGMTNGISLKWLVSILEQNGYAKVITRPNTTVKNHSVAYLSVGDEKDYVKSVKITQPTTANGVTTPGTVEPEVATYKDGVQFAVRVDKMLTKDRITVSLAPYISKTTEIEKVYGGNPITLLRKNVVEAPNGGVTIRDGDIIIFGGLKQDVTTKNVNEPLISYIPFLGQVFKNRSENNNYSETVFMVRVTKIKNPKDTFKIPSYKAKQLYRDSTN